MSLTRMDHLALRAAEPLPVPAGYRVRPFRRTDWDDCLELMLANPDPHYTGGPWNRELCQSSLAFSADEHDDYPEGRGQLAFFEDTLVAMALAGGTGYLNQVYTHRHHRRRGLAAAVISRVLVALHRADLPRCFLMVYASNRPAIRCYEKLGFVTVWTGILESGK